MDAIQLLTQQHRELEASLEKLLESETGRRRALLTDVGDRLAEHLASEEQVFYPAVHKGKTEDVLLESLEEHLSLKRLLADLLHMQAGQPQFEAKIKVLKEQAEHHHKEEEENLFPTVEKMMSAPARLALGEEMLQLQQSMGRSKAGASARQMAEDTEQAAPLV